jgi:hypothetical protein
MGKSDYTLQSFGVAKSLPLRYPEGFPIGKYIIFAAFNTPYD